MLVLMGFFAVPGDARAWGDTAHKVICEIAMRLVAPNTQAEVRRLLKTDAEFVSFADACTWPDHPRKRAAEHFLNLARDSSGLTSDACPDAPGCVLTAIRQDAAVLSSSNASDQEKLEALKFLSHWVGDIHQPLHVSFKDDRGGNYIGVVGACSGNLHSAWDTCLVHKAVGMDFEDAAVELLGSISPVKVEEWTRSTPTGWANESFAISERSQTKYCVQVGTACIAPDAGKVRIDATYIQENAPIIREQLQKAGVRLAHLLDAALGR